MTTQVAAISEIFSSLQGEGTHVGERHIFVRFDKCNIHCGYCDELGKPASSFDLQATIAQIQQLEAEKGPHAAVSLTGGEPLVYTSFLVPLMRQLKALGFRTYLETNGILTKALEQVIELTDIVAMDVKPSSVTKEKSFLAEHEEFLKVSLAKETFIKMICSTDIDLAEFQEHCAMIARVNKNVPLILQPISTHIEGHEDPELMTLLGELQTVALGYLNHVRIVPRLHRILKIK